VPSPDPSKRVIGLRYDEAQDAAPRVIAKGEGLVADRVLALAEEHGIPVREDPDLLQLLSTADVGEEIPVEVYTAVAQVLTYLYGLNSELAARPDNSGSSLGPHEPPGCVARTPE